MEIAKIGQDSIDVILENDLPGIEVLKPAIYLYPEQTTTVSVKHHFKGTVLNTFPPYEEGWKVIATPEGKLKNIADNRNYSYLFWDGKTNFSKKHFDYKEGFYVSRKDNIAFLQEQLSLLGLNETETNDFIVYWLPQLNRSERNFIHFWVNDNIDHTSTLEVQPKPETMIRIFMEFMPYDGKKPMLPKQLLPRTPRKGFVLVEWGGGPVGSSKIE
ncbi:hypothetical protein DBR32_05440 [Taibaiella sp. KBW10]|uniref:hypothetical protein n=1 Tax=Taibaiella sp. KBW10 TaxID=2153357 RepID=UPI000F5A5C8B|nr:hypothetical protein [Taibaiella sp. KBW10]RQO31407.1 hypothetical protein DBR32_05440 [Taibaiella sp. KBW10]